MTLMFVNVVPVVIGLILYLLFMFDYKNLSDVMDILVGYSYFVGLSW